MVGAQAEEHGGAIDGPVSLLGDIQDSPPALLVGQAFAGHGEGGEVGLGAAACEDALRRFRHPQPCAKPVEDDQLDLCRPSRLLPDAGEEVGPRTQQVAKDGDPRRRAGDEGEEARVIDTNGVGDDLRDELVEDGGEVAPRLRRRFGEKFGQRRG